MAKNQSQRPGRDVRGGKGKGRATSSASSVRQGKGSGGAGRKAGSYAGKRGAGAGRAGDARAARPARGEGQASRRPHDTGGTWIEGRRAVAEALEVGMPLRRALVSDADTGLASLVRQLEQDGVPVERASKKHLDNISSHGAHQGICVQVEPFAYASLDDILARAGEDDALVLLLDHVTDQGNLGAIVRSAEVVGAAGVIIPKARAAGVGVGAYKTSAGAVLHLPIAQVANLATAIETLQERGFWVCGSTEHAHDDVWSAPMGGRLCLVMGSEGSGISRLVRERCDFECRLPQRGQVESLNVAQAATVMCYEWLRRTTAEAAQRASAAEGMRVVPSAADSASGVDAYVIPGAQVPSIGEQGASGFELSDVHASAVEAGQSFGSGLPTVSEDTLPFPDEQGSHEATTSAVPNDGSYLEDAAAGSSLDWDL